MKFAINSLKKRIKPEFSGQKATCPFCNGSLIGKCGEIYTWHWQHQVNTECDSWKEYETAWHRTWKNKFPDSWQEVIINNDDEKHIADVRTPNGDIIEFQNSPISSSTIRIREEFYKNMVWVVNAIEFKENFKIWSLVRAKKREIEAIYFDELRYLNENDYQDKSSKNNDIQKKKLEIETKKEELIYKTKKHERIKNLLENLDDLTNSVFDKWLQSRTYYNTDLSEIINKLSIDFKELVITENQKISRLKHEKDKVKKYLLRINNLPTKQINNKTFWVVEYNNISTTSFSKVKAIVKETVNSLFVETKDFMNEFDFTNFHYYKDNHLFVIDFADDISLSESLINKNNSLLEELTNSISSYRIEFNKQLSELLKNKTEKIDEEIKTLCQNIKQLKKEQKDLMKKQTSELNYRREKIETYKNQQKEKMDNHITYTMRKFKGHYGFEWKYERKSWQEANCPIFFDIGEKYLFELVKDGIFRKIDKNKFIETFSNI